MTLSCAARYPELWACAIDTVGMYDLVTFLDNTAEYRRAHRESEYGSLTEHYEILKAVSPAAKIAYYGAFYGLPWVEVRGWILEYNREAIHICFDNDNAGCKAANALYKQLSPKYEAFVEPPTQGKDYNDQLLYERGLPKTFKTRITKNHNKEDLTK